MEPGEELLAEGFRPSHVLNHEAKLRALLRNLCSVEVEIYSEASKEFVKLLKGDSGGDLLQHYLQLSPRCAELLEAWRMRVGKPGMIHVFALVAAVLKHPAGKPGGGDGTASLDRLARSIVSQKLDDVYRELNSKEFRRQNAALRLLAAVVRRGAGLASEVAAVFDFKLPVLATLSGVRKKKDGKKTQGRCFTRKAFADFAVSFLEVGSPSLLNRILQQRDVYSGLLRGIRSDDDDTVVLVLTVLRDKVLTAKSMISPGLRSVLFGSVTLEQLIGISGNPNGGDAADLTHQVLVAVCTDPCNGLMPGPGLKGNSSRLLELMKKLKATEIGTHKELLLAITKQRLSLCSSYMDAFPYSLEPSTSPQWFSAISLAADLISSMTSETALGLLLKSDSPGPPSIESYETQCILKCIVPRLFVRSVSNKGLLHSNVLVKHASLRLVMEMFKSLLNFFTIIDAVVEKEKLKQYEDGSRSAHASFRLPGLPSFNVIDSYLLPNESVTTNPPDSYAGKWVLFKSKIQDQVRSMLPDPQVLLKLLSSLSFKGSGKSVSSLRRCERLQESPYKRPRLEVSTMNDDMDIVLGGVHSESNTAESMDFAEHSMENDAEKYLITMVESVWDIQKPDAVINGMKDVEILFHTKLLDVITFYLRTMPSSLEGTFDFLKTLPSDPSGLSLCQKQSLLSLLAEYARLPIGKKEKLTAPDMMYKHLQPLLKMMILTEETIRQQSCILSRLAMLSTGAFDQNLSEVDVWFLFLPGYRDKLSIKLQQELHVQMAAVIISFLSDAVSTIGNNLYWYLDRMRVLLSNFTDDSLSFGPFVICILQKCLRLLDSDSGTFKICDKTMISLYVCNSICFLLQIQENAYSLASLVDLVLTEKFGDPCSVEDSTKSSFCEWRALKNLLVFSRNILHQRVCNNVISLPGSRTCKKSTSISALTDMVREMIENHPDSGILEIAISFSSSVVCASSDDIMEILSSLITVSQHHFGAYPQSLSSVLFLEWGFLSSFFQQWPDIFQSGFEIIEEMSTHKCYNCISDTSDLKDFVDNVMKKPISDCTSTKENASFAFSLFLKHIPFHCVFLPIMNFISCNKSATTKMLNFLNAKMSEKFEDSVMSLRLVLFWAYHLRSSYKSKDSESLVRLFEMCYSLIDNFLGHLLVLPTGEVIFECASKKESMELDTIWEIAELILLHPLLIEISSYDLLVKDHSFDNPEDILNSSKSSVHIMDRYITDIMRKIADLLLSLWNHWSIAIPEKLSKAFRGILKRLVTEFKKCFKYCIEGRHLNSIFPSFYVFNVLISFQFPMELLDLGHWMLCQIDDRLAGLRSSEVSVLPLALHVCGCAFDAFCTILKQNKLNRMHALLWEGESYKDYLPQMLYNMVLDIALRFNIESANVCLLKAVTAAYIQKRTQSTLALLPFSILVSRMVCSSPSKIIKHCISNTEKTKSKLLFMLIGVSTLHMDLFGMNLYDIIDKQNSVMKSDISLLETVKNSSDLVSWLDSFILMVPAALLFFISKIEKYGQDNPGICHSIPLFYSKLLLDGFTKWNSFIARDIFYEDYNEYMHNIEELNDVFGGTLLGKCLLMLQHYFAVSSENLVKKIQCLEIFKSLYDSASMEDELLDFHIIDIKQQSYSELFNHLNRTVGKISFTYLLLFPHDNLDQTSMGRIEKDPDMPCITKKGRHVTLKFMHILICAFNKIVRSFPFEQSSCNVEPVGSRLLRFVEVFILKKILQLAEKVKSQLTGSSSISFLEKFVKCTLLYRFEDPLSLRALHTVLDFLQGGYSCGEVLELLLGHSKFASILLMNVKLSDPSSLVNNGAFLQPVPSIFREIDYSFSMKSECSLRETEKKYLEASSLNSHCSRLRIELIRLVRLLYNLNTQQQGSSHKVVGMEKEELLSLLMSGYNASVSDTDRVIYHFIQEIESSTGSNSVGISDMDYYWGVSALKFRREQSTGKSDSPSDPDAVQERSRQFFRENLSIDAKLCAFTALNLWHDYPKLAPSTQVKEFPLDNLRLANSRRISYDPFFIMRFSIHSLLKGYIEPLEFARLGLLAVSLVALSSCDDNLRKLAYEFLGYYQNSLADHRKSKDALQLQLLLTCLQNGITENWQRIPSMAAIFAAEASFVLLDTSQDHFHAISKLLMQSSKLDFKEVPLFHTFLSSNSTCKIERLWILRMILGGLNVDDDAYILVNGSVIKVLLSYYVTSFSDSQGRFLILQIVKKAVKFRVLVRHMIEDCGLICWLYSVLLNCGSRDFGARNDYSQKVFCIVLEVIHDVISSRYVTEFLQQDALEMLSSISTYLHFVIVCQLKSLKRDIWMVNTAIEIIRITLRISQKRKLYQPHFTLSLDGIFQLCRSIYKGIRLEEHSHTFRLGLDMLLMCSPRPILDQMDRVKLLNITLWAISAALRPNSDLMSFLKEPCVDTLCSMGLENKKIISRLLRWITASVLLGCLSCSRLKEYASFNRPRNKNLQSLLECAGMENDMHSCDVLDINVNIALAVTILHLQQLLGTFSDLSSLISALCLLFKDANSLSEVVVCTEDHGFSFMQLCSKINHPIEANPSWRWSFFQPWKDHSYRPTSKQQIEEEQACRTLLLMFSNIVECKSQTSSAFSHEDLEHLFAWNRSILLRKD